MNDIFALREAARAADLANRVIPAEESDADPFAHIVGGESVIVWLTSDEVRNMGTVALGYGNLGTVDGVKVTFAAAPRYLRDAMLAYIDGGREPIALSVPSWAVLTVGWC